MFHPGCGWTCLAFWPGLSQWICTQCCLEFPKPPLQVPQGALLVPRFVSKDRCQCAEVITSAGLHVGWEFSQPLTTVSLVSLQVSTTDHVLFVLGYAEVEDQWVPNTLVAHNWDSLLRSCVVSQRINECNKDFGEVECSSHTAKGDVLISSCAGCPKLFFFSSAKIFTVCENRGKQLVQGVGGFLCLEIIRWTKNRTEPTDISRGLFTEQEVKLHIESALVCCKTRLALVTSQCSERLMQSTIVRRSLQLNRIQGRIGDPAGGDGFLETWNSSSTRKLSRVCVCVSWPFLGQGWASDALFMGIF